MFVVYREGEGEGGRKEGGDTKQTNNKACRAFALFDVSETRLETWKGSENGWDWYGQKG